MSLRSLAIVAGLVAGLAVPAAANAAYTAGAVNIRSGAGINHRVIAVAPPGAYVAVRKCVPRWCRVTYRGITGWMSSAYIAGTPRRVVRPRVAVYPRVYYYPRAYYYPRPYYWGYSYPHMYVYYYDRPKHHHHAKPKKPKK
jgi:uncharacterized protein YraI